MTKRQRYGVATIPGVPLDEWRFALAMAAYDDLRRDGELPRDEQHEEDRLAEAFAEGA